MLVVFGWFSGKMEEIIKNLGNIGGPSPLRRDPSPQRSNASPQRGRVGRMARPRVRRDEATIHSMEMLCFCFVLFFCCSEDLSIGLIRTL